MKLCFWQFPSTQTINDEIKFQTKHNRNQHYFSYTEYTEEYSFSLKKAYSSVKKLWIKMTNIDKYLKCQLCN